MYPELAQFKTWLKCQYPTSSASVHYSSDLALFFLFAKKPPAKITPKDVDHYISHSLQLGNKRTTINRRLSALRTFYYFLSMTEDLPPACPVLTRHRLRKSYPLPRDADDADIESLFNVLKSSRDRTMFLLMLDCGLRIGEVHSLSLDDVHFEDPPHVLVHGKGDRQRIVYLSQRAQDALIEWLNSRPISTDRAVFISEHGKRLSISGIQYLLRCYCKTAGIHFSCHQLRHTFGRRMAEAKMPLASLQSFLGHRSVRTTQIYVHLSNDHLQAEYNRAITGIGAPEPVATLVTRPQSRCVHKSKEINWDGYLSGLPDWLVDLIRAYCSQYSQANDPIQQARNRLSQLSGIFRWICALTSLSCLEKLTPKLWFACVETRLKLGREPASINTTLRVLHSFLRFVRDPGHLICERMLEIRPLKTSELLPRDVTEAQLNQLLRHANLLDHAWMLLMAHSGLRTCEIRTLRWQDVDLKLRTARIEESKGLRSRVVFLSVATIKALKQLSKTPDYVFTDNNTTLRNRYYQSRLATIGKKCGIHVKPHQLWHTCATMLLNAGMSIFGVQAILGHRYVDTTLRYARAYDATIAIEYQRAAGQLNETKST